MTVNELIKTLSAEPVNIADGEREVLGGYAGDLLSFVMGRAPMGCAWFTVMTNVNICAVAALADVAVVVVCEGSKADEVATARAKEQNINVIQTDLDIFGAIKRFINESKV